MSVFQEKPFPTGFLGKNWEDLNREELMEAIRHLWKLYQKDTVELSKYESNIHNIKT